MQFSAIAICVTMGAASFVVGVGKDANAAILYLNSTRGAGTGNLGNYRSAIANTLETYGDGTVFEIDYVQTHQSGDLASYLNAQPVGYYEQIWFDTTILKTALLNEADLTALNAWAAYDQPEFILDSSFFYRNRRGFTVTDSAAAVTVNQALALRNAGGGILIGTDHQVFTQTANQVLTNFGFDGLFTSTANITSDGSFVGDLLLDPESVDNEEFFTQNLQGLSTSTIPVGEHILNENGNNRMLQIYEALYSLSPDKVVHIGASFDTGNQTTPINNPEAVPEPSTILGGLLAGVLVWFQKLKSA